MRDRRAQGARKRIPRVEGRYGVFQGQVKGFRRTKAFALRGEDFGRLRTVLTERVGHGARRGVHVPELGTKER